MFYTQLLMNKRGPLAKIWLAAHWEKKLKKSHIFECDLETTIENMLSPKFKLALRTSGHLLLGVVRIYHRKTKYLLADCNEALLKMQSAFRPELDLPEGNSELNYYAITLPEEFHDFDTQLPDLNAIDVAEHFTLNQSRAEDITLIEEDYRRDLLLHGDSFGEEIEMPRQHSFLNDSVLASSGGLLADHSFLSFTEDKTAVAEEVYSFKYDGFGDEGVAGDMIDAVLGDEQNSHVITDFNMEEEFSLLQELPTDDTAGHSRSEQEARSRQINETTFLLNEEEGLVLEPLDDSVLTRKQRGKKKRKLLVDYVNQLSRTTMQNQLMDYKDTLTALTIAPPTRRLMILHDLGSVDKLLGRPTLTLINEDLQKLFAKSLWKGRRRLQELAAERSKEQEVQELPTAEVPDTMLETTCQFVSQSSREESRNKEIIEPMETVGGVSAMPGGSSRESSVRLAVESNQAAVEKGNEENDLDNEERNKNKRALQLLNTFRDMHQTGAKSFNFQTLCKNKTKKEAATKFYSLLVLKKQQAIEVAQAAPYADIVVTGFLVDPQLTNYPEFSQRDAGLLTNHRELLADVLAGVSADFSTQTCGSMAMSLPGSRRPSTGSRRRPSPPVSMRDTYGTSSLSSSSNSGSCKGSDSSPTPRRPVKYLLCSDNHGIKPPTPEQYLTPLQQKEVCIRHLRARLKDTHERLQDRDAEIEDLKTQLSRMQEDWIEEECHRVEAQLALKEARKEIKQLKQVIDTVKNNLMEKDKGLQKYFVDINIQNKKLETLLHSMEVAQDGAVKEEGAAESVGGSPARSLTRSSTYTKLSDQGAADRNLGGSQTISVEEAADSGFVAADDSLSRTDLLDQSSLLSSGVECSTDDTSLQTNFTLGSRVPTSSTYEKLMGSQHSVEAAVQASCMQEQAIQTDFVQYQPDLDTILEKVMKSQACSLSSPTSVWVSEMEDAAEPNSSEIQAQSFPGGPTDMAEANPSSAVLISAGEEAENANCMENANGHASSPGPAASSPTVHQPSSQSVSVMCAPDDEEAASEPGQEVAAVGAREPQTYWSRHFIVDLLAVVVPAVPTVAWLCRSQRRQGQPIYNISSLLRGCCTVALHSIRKISCRSVANTSSSCSQP